MTLTGYIGQFAALLTLFMCWSWVAWMGLGTWFLLTYGESEAAIRGMRISALAGIITGSGAVVIGGVAMLIDIALSATATGAGW
jgi:hypothetical protein